MHVAAIVLSVALALLFFGSGRSKLVGDKQSGRRDDLRADQRLWSLIGVLEVAGGVGLLVGLVVPVLGIAAAIGLALLMVAAVVRHGRVGDLPHAVPAVVVLIVAGATAALGIASM
jgi:uncharacterized membrane protein YphA (DoxX/SURF4 family)